MGTQVSYSGFYVSNEIYGGFVYSLKLAYVSFIYFRKENVKRGGMGVGERALSLF